MKEMYIRLKDLLTGVLHSEIDSVYDRIGNCREYLVDLDNTTCGSFANVEARLRKLEKLAKSSKSTNKKVKKKKK